MNEQRRKLFFLLGLIGLLLGFNLSWWLWEWSRQSGQEAGRPASGQTAPSVGDTALEAAKTKAVGRLTNFSEGARVVEPALLREFTRAGIGREDPFAPLATPMVGTMVSRASQTTAPTQIAAKIPFFQGGTEKDFPREKTSGPAGAPRVSSSRSEPQEGGGFPSPEKPQAPPPLRVKGIVCSGAVRLALVEGAGKSVIVGVGEKIGGRWLVKEITEQDLVVEEQEGKQWRLPLKSQ